MKAIQAEITPDSNGPFDFDISDWDWIATDPVVSATALLDVGSPTGVNITSPASVIDPNTIRVNVNGNNASAGLYKFIVRCTRNSGKAGPVFFVELTVLRPRGFTG